MQNCGRTEQKNAARQVTKGHVSTRLFLAWIRKLSESFDSALAPTSQSAPYETEINTLPEWLLHPVMVDIPG